MWTRRIIQKLYSSVEIMVQKLYSTLDLLRGAKRRGGEFDRKQSLMLSCGTLDLPRGAKRPRR